MWPAENQGHNPSLSCRVFALQILPANVYKPVRASDSKIHSLPTTFPPFSPKLQCEPYSLSFFSLNTDFSWKNGSMLVVSSMEGKNTGNNDRHHYGALPTSQACENHTTCIFFLVRAPLWHHSILQLIHHLSSNLKLRSLRGQGLCLSCSVSKYEKNIWSFWKYSTGTLFLILSIY